MSDYNKLFLLFMLAVVLLIGMGIFACWLEQKWTESKIEGNRLRNELWLRDNPPKKPQRVPGGAR